MLELVNVKKEYPAGDTTVQALKGIDLRFRKNEFVSILGHSGCGKTTMLNIIGGLDHYTSGDLIIEGVSTKKYSDRDWDTYRNHSIGFIFQSYHLIPHQSILQNVELALTLSGVGKKERRKRAIEALEKVGLDKRLHNRPNQLSGGQAQRVAIARALINDPEIVLADEPTGALDSETSVQIMELLKEIAKERLVIMVTHNPELAEKYSTRIIRLVDGEVVGDTNPCTKEELDAENGLNLAEKVEDQPKKKKNKQVRKKQSSMSRSMAMGLSFKNLLSKRKRTAMVSFAGSIGIIGVSMVLAVSAGIKNYIASMENDMLSGYPLTIAQSTVDFSSLMTLSEDRTNDQVKDIITHPGERVYVNSLLKTLGTLTDTTKTNDISEDYINYLNAMPKEYYNVIQYSYAFNVINNLYTDFSVTDGTHKTTVENDEHYAYAEGTSSAGKMSISAIRAMYASVLSETDPQFQSLSSMISSVSAFQEMPNNFDYIMSQYDVLAMDKNGSVSTSNYNNDELKRLFEAKDSLIMVINHDRIDELTLAQYGYFSQEEFIDYALKGVSPEDNAYIESLVGDGGLPYSCFIGNTAKKYTYYPNDLVYTIPGGTTKSFAAQNMVTKLYPKGYSMDKIMVLFSVVPQIMDAKTPEGQKTPLQKLEEGDESLKSQLSFMLKGLKMKSPEAPDFTDEEIEEIYQAMRSSIVVSSYVASAYDCGYTYVNAKGEEINLMAFEKALCDEVGQPLEKYKKYDGGKTAYDMKVDLGVKLILQKKSNVSYGCLNSGFYYTNALTKHILEVEAKSEIVKDLSDGSVLSEVPYAFTYAYVDTAHDEEKGRIYKTGVGFDKISDGAVFITNMLSSYMGGSSPLSASSFGLDKPISVKIYPVDFETKSNITDYLDKWNAWCEEETPHSYVWKDNSNVEHTAVLDETKKITYNDTVGLIMAMINTMIEIVTIALVCFTGLSLVVSTVMIGIITYVSVVERIKEIGILRAVGARKKDIKRLFNAETFMIGLSSGIVGIGITYLLSIIANAIIGSLTGIYTIAALPLYQAFIMIVISVILTLISGLIPASAAAKKDPVVALRTE